MRRTRIATIATAAAAAALLTLTPSCACAAHAFFLEHPTINALVGYLEGRSLARRARALSERRRRGG